MTDEVAEKPAETAPVAETTEGNRIVPTVSEAIPVDEVARITADLIGVLKTVYDPEIPVDIYELGLIYKVDVSDDKDVVIDMTLTAPGCPVAGEMPGWVEDAVKEIPEIRSCKVELVFEPPWDPSRMSDEAKLQLNMF
jgi:FeS assembly SUF system protein